ncbi:Transposase [Bifidobacterium longum subsp. longum]|nr:Transposase [Bifidobacterium longum subsp. longum]
MGQQYSHLSSDERILIEKLHCERHLSVRKIAEEIGRDKSTVSRELRRGLWFASNENGSYRPYRPKRLKTGPWTSGPFYSALAAQRKADLRRRGSRKPRRMDSDRLRAWVLDSLRRGWSPELIEGRLKAQYAGDPSMRISHECLYQWIYAKPQRALDLRQYLARGRKRRTRKKGRKAKGPRIPMRVPIADRPEAVGSRKGFGHFESDTVVGAAPSRRCMNTQVERRSRRLFARLVDDKSASATARAEYEIFKDMPPAARVDRTWDNGTEASLHMLVDEALGMLTYFADPVQLLAARQQREQERQDPPLSAQRNRVRGLGPGGPRRDRRGDQRHPDEAPRLQNAQRGMGRGDRQATIEGSQPEHKRCAYKLNPGRRGIRRRTARISREQGCCTYK